MKLLFETHSNVPDSAYIKGFQVEETLFELNLSKYLAAYLLLNASGATPSADSIKTVLESVGIEVEDEQVSTLLSSLEGKSVEELIAEGNEKLASVPTGGAGAAPAGAATGAAAEEAAAEEVEEEKEESDDDMGFGLFD